MAPKILALALLLSSLLPSPSCAGWSELMASAIEAGNHDGIMKVLANRKTGNALEVDFSHTVTAWKALGTGTDIRGALTRNFLGPLKATFSEASSNSYVSLLRDSSVPDVAKTVLLQAMIEKGQSLMPASAEQVRKSVKALAADAGLPMALRIAAIKGLALGSQGTDEDSTYLPYLSAPDSNLKVAAYWALGQRIRSNRDKHRVDENLRIFSVLKNRAENGGGPLPIRALAQLGLDTARNYLASKCSGDAEKLEVVLKHDPYLDHPGLIAEALKMEQDPIHGKAIALEIQNRVRTPDLVVSGMFQGTSPDIEAGLMLIKDFPALAPKYVSAIEEFAVSPVLAVSEAAHALEPLISVSNAPAY